MSKRRTRAKRRERKAALSLAELAAVLRKIPAGETITAAMVQADVKLCPALLVDGKVDLVRYAAWLLRRHGYGEKGGGGVS